MVQQVQINQLNGLQWTDSDLQKKFQESYLEATLLNGSKKPFYTGVIYLAMIPSGANQAQVKYYPDAHGPGGSTHTFGYAHILVGDDKPEPCITNYGETAVLFTYNPARQWRRGFGNHNCFLYSGQTGAPAMGITIWTPQLAQKLISPDHMPIKIALEWFKANPQGTARAINNHYWLIKSNEALKLYRGKAFVGTFIGKKFFIKGEAEIFREELRTELPILREAAYGYA